MNKDHNFRQQFSRGRDRRQDNRRNFDDRSQRFNGHSSYGNSGYGGGHEQRRLEEDGGRELGGSSGDFSYGYGYSDAAGGVSSPRQPQSQSGSIRHRAGSNQGRVFNRRHSGVGPRSNIVPNAVISDQTT